MSTIDQHKSERLQARVTPEQKALLQRAAQLSGRSLTDFVVTSAQDAAFKAIETFEVLQLSQRDSALLAESLLNPHAPNQSLQETAEAYKKLVR